MCALPFGDYRDTRVITSVISGGLNGGAVSDILTTEVLASTIMAILGTYYLISSVAAVGLYMMAPYACMIATVLLVTLISYLVFEMYTSYYDYLDTGNLDDYVDTEDKAGILMLIGSMETMSAEYLLAYKMANAGSGDIESEGKGDGGSPKGLVGRDFEDYLVKEIGGEGSFKAGGREFDGRIGNRWWEAKSGGYWELLENDSNELLKFKSDMGDRLRIATENGATYELFSNTPIPDSIKEWLIKRGIQYTELLD